MLQSGCSTLRESLIVGAGSGAVVGGVAGAQSDGDRSENTIKGAVIGGVVGGFASYFIHGSLEKRDANVRRETLMNLEHYEVMGFENLSPSSNKNSDSKCYTTQEVDGRLVSIPCRLVNESGQNEVAE
ncbi:MAG: glycine zipper 2TM domain-containing protein [Pseudobdellovibrionaceae bacterium]